MTAGRPKGTRVVVCRCGWRVTGHGESGTCTTCGARVRFPKRKRRKAKKS
jgi:hypothetical protein